MPKPTPDSTYQLRQLAIRHIAGFHGFEQRADGAIAIVDSLARTLTVCDNWQIVAEHIRGAVERAHTKETAIIDNFIKTIV